MAEVFTHMESRERILGFANQRIAEIKRDVREYYNRLSMYTKIRVLMTCDPEMSDFIQADAELLKSKMAQLTREKEVWIRIRTKLNPCPHCGGFGKERRIEEQDHSRQETCYACRGSGIATQNEPAAAFR